MTSLLKSLRPAGLRLATPLHSESQIGLNLIRSSRKWPLLFMLLLSFALTLGIQPPASAIDGRVPDGRSGSPRSEISAYYWHGLDRDPDSGGLANYMSFVNQDCRWGILDAGIKILDSGEAHRRWRGNAQDLAGALYASLLNRPPDRGGLRTYTDAIQQRGLRWSITAMQSSDEFRSRLDRICAGQRSTNATVWSSHDAVVQAIRLNDGASKLVEACGVGILINTLAPLKAGVFKEAPKIIKAGKIAAGTALKVGGSACLPAYRAISAADKLVTLADYGGANNPVFLEADSRSYWNAIGHWCENWFRVGPNAMSWTGYKVNYRCN